MSTSDAAAAFSTLADLQRGMAARSGGSGPSVALPLAAAQLPLKVAMYPRGNAGKPYREAVEQQVRARQRIAFRLRGRGETPEYFRSREPAGAQRDAEEAGDQLTLL